MSILLLAFEESARLSERHFCCVLEPAARLAEVLEGTEPLGLYERHTLCQAPLDARDTLHAECLRGWGRDISRRKVAAVRYAPPQRPPKTHAELQALESFFRALDGYLWLAPRFADSFPQEQVDKAIAYRETVRGCGH